MNKQTNSALDSQASLISFCSSLKGMHVVSIFVLFAVNVSDVVVISLFEISLH